MPDDEPPLPDGEYDIELPDLTDEQILLLLQGLVETQVTCLQHDDVDGAKECAKVMFQAANENPEAVRETFLKNNQFIEAIEVPDHFLDTLNLELTEDGHITRPDNDPEWEDVDIE
jgi:hypothetical protein